MKKKTYISAVTEALAEEMERDESVFIIGEDVDIDGGVWNETAGLLERFGENGWSALLFPKGHLPDLPQVRH